MSTYKEIVFEPSWHDHTALLAINRPHEFNSYTLTTLREMVDAIERAMWDDNIQFIVLTGVGDKAFCTGGNVHEYAEEYNRKSADFWKWGEIYGRVFDMILHCGKPVIARVNGAVAGGGFEFVCACGHRQRERAFHLAGAACGHDVGGRPLPVAAVAHWHQAGRRNCHAQHGD